MGNFHKKGFNLIEIAIVLAVVGLVIGGIYVAASSVTENTRQQRTLTDLLQISSNVRRIYVNQAPMSGSFGASILPVATLNNLRIMPANISYSGTGFTGSYGAISVEYNSTASQFAVRLQNVSRGGCVNIFAKAMGSAAIKNGYGIVGINVNGTGLSTTTDTTLAELATNCVEGANAVGIAFSQY